MRASLTSISGVVLSLFATAAAANNANNQNDPQIEEMIVQGRQSDYSVITESAQKIIDVPGALGDPLMAVFSLPGVISEAMVAVSQRYAARRQVTIVIWSMVLLLRMSSMRSLHRSSTTISFRILICIPLVLARVTAMP